MHNIWDFKILKLFLIYSETIFGNPSIHKNADGVVNDDIVGLIVNKNKKFALNTTITLSVLNLSISTKHYDTTTVLSLLCMR